MMSNLLKDYQDIFETYITGFGDLEFDINTQEGSVTFKRHVFIENQDKVLTSKYTFDKETLEAVNPSAELLKISLYTLANTAMDLAHLDLTNMTIEEKDAV